MFKRVPVLSRLEAAGLLQVVEGLPESWWLKETYIYTPAGSQAITGSHSTCPFASMSKSVRERLLEAAPHYPGLTLWQLSINRLSPGQSIPPHRDYEPESHKRNLSLCLKAAPGSGITTARGTTKDLAGQAIILPTGAPRHWVRAVSTFRYTVILSYSGDLSQSLRATHQPRRI